MTWGLIKRYGGKCAARHRMRCSRGKKGCGTRFTLKKHPKRYKRAVRCPYCKSTHVVSVEVERRRQQLRENTCYCHMYPFPHRAGSLRLCTENPNTAEPTDEDLQDYYRTLETARSG